MKYWENAKRCLQTKYEGRYLDKIKKPINILVRTPGFQIIDLPYATLRNYYS